MRSNGLRLALAMLLAPVPVCAQTAPAAVPPAGTTDAPVSEAGVGEAAQPTTQAPVTEAPVPPPATVTPVENAPVEGVPAGNAPVEGAPLEGVPLEGVPLEGVPPAEVPAEDAPAETQAAPAPDAAAATATPTDAEQAFGDIYGTQEYDPVADPTLPEAAVMPGTFDPWEGYNRRMHRFNNAVDRAVAQPLARGYVKVVPRPMRLGVSNFFNNLGQPLTVINSLLQGKGRQAGQAFGRFLLNSTFGLGGIFDPASRAQLPQKSEDFGQTLGVWGWKRSRYVELPLFGPRTVRDIAGMSGDAPLSPLRGIEADRIRIPMQGLQLVDVRSQLLSTDSLREGAEDDYTLVRDAWSQRRDYQIFGDQRSEEGNDLPDYLREDEDDSTVPVDAMPVLVPGGSD